MLLERHEDVNYIDDGQQLPTIVLITTTKYPFVNVLSFGPFHRFFELDLSMCLLEEMMRISIGLEDFATTIFYDLKLVFDLDVFFGHLKREI